MLACKMCAFQSICRVNFTQHNIRYHRYDENFVVNCEYGGCGACYRNWGSFKSHLTRKHKYQDIPEEQPMPMPIPMPLVIAANVDAGVLEEEELEEVIAQGLVEGADPEVQHLNDICGQYVKYIQHIREGSNISQKATDRVTEGIIEFSDSTVDALKAHLLRSADEDGKISTVRIEDVCNEFKLSGAMENVKTKHLLDQHLIRSGFLIMPLPVTLGLNWCWVKKPRVHLVRKPVSFYEVPFFSMLQQVLNQDDILECVDNPRPSRDDGILGDYQDGNYVKSHPIFGIDPKALKIILYYDDVEVVNPLGSKVKHHKLAMFYWTLGNVYPEFRSTLKVINLLCIVESVNLRKYGMVKVLENFVRDIKTLESPEGKVLLIKGVERTFRGSLLMFTGDTLAANYVGGYKEGVALAKKPCRACLGTDVTIREQFKESRFLLRDKITHSEHCDTVNAPGLTDQEKLFWTKEYGVMGRSILCDIETFDVTKCLCQDLMHVVIEGVLELEMRYFLNYCISNRFIKLKKFNQNICDFNYGHLVKDRPTLIEPSHLTNKLRQNCAQLITLGNALPFLLDDCLDDEDEHLINLILLLQILNGMLCYQISVDEIALMKQMIEVHHRCFVSLYRSPTPKFHFMIHMPSQMLMFGPSRHQWCMRFEGAHCRFKHLANVVKNFKNIAFTLAYRHQSLRCAQLYTLPNAPSRKILYCGDIVASGVSVILRNHAHRAVVSNCLNVENFEKSVLCTKNVTVKGTSYSIGGVILLSDEDAQLPQFGKITEIVVIESAIAFLFTTFRTLFYEPTKNAYLVRNLIPETVRAIAVDALLHPHPLSLFRVESGSYVLLLNHSRNEYH